MEQSELPNKFVEAVREVESLRVSGQIADDKAERILKIIWDVARRGGFAAELALRLPF